MRPDDTFGLLARIKWDCPGAVQFSRPDELSDMLARLAEIEPVSDVDIKERLRAFRNDPRRALAR